MTPGMIGMPTFPFHPTAKKYFLGVPSSGDRIRTCDFKVMSLASYLCSTPLFYLWFFMFLLTALLENYLVCCWLQYWLEFLRSCTPRQRSQHPNRFSLKGSGLRNFTTTLFSNSSGRGTRTPDQILPSCGL